jgi:hypothetical protein
MHAMTLTKDRPVLSSERAPHKIKQDPNFVRFEGSTAVTMMIIISQKMIIIKTLTVKQ